MPKKLIPGEERTPVYKKGPFKMGYKHSAFPFFSGFGPIQTTPTPPNTETDTPTTGGFARGGAIVGTNPNIDRINELEKELAALRGSTGKTAII